MAGSMPAVRYILLPHHSLHKEHTIARATTPTKFTVEATHSQFPIDMLRYDSCYPAAEEMAARIEATFRRGHYETTQVTLVKPNGGEPTVGRWNSFGWTVIS
jgi:hypothetical protein